MSEKEGGFETPQQRFEREVVNPIKKAMEEAISQATSKEDVKQRILTVMPKNRDFSGPLVIYSDPGGEKQRYILATILIRDDQDEIVKIEVESGEKK